jgi:hypothetical protein
MVPGGMGRGTFDCQGTAPYGFDNPLGPEILPFQDMDGNPFNNPFMNGGDDPLNSMLNPAFQNPLFNDGFGPDMLPILGNGLDDYRMGNDPLMNDPFWDPFNPNNRRFGPRMPPGVLPDPYMYGNYLNDRWDMNRLSSLYRMNDANGYPSYSRYQGLPDIAPYWGNPRPEILPIVSGGAGDFGMNNMPYTNQWVSQIDQLRRNVQYIQNGSYYGGTPPAVLRMPGPGLNYQHGSPQNPQPPPSGPQQIR